MNITEAHAVDKVLSALARLDAIPPGVDPADVEGSLLTDAEQRAVCTLRERAAKPLLVSPEAIGRAVPE